MPEFVAHRGESIDAPENTMAAFRLAWARGVEVFELDARLTSDGQLIVCHDADALRTTGTAMVVAEHTASELRALEANALHRPAYAGERMPLLDEVVAAMPSGVCCLVELKSGPECVPELERVLADAGDAAHRVTLISFSDSTLAAARKALPDQPRWLITGFRRDAGGTQSPSFDEVMHRALELGVDGVALDRHGRIDAATVAQVHAEGLELNVWTVDEAEHALPLVRLGVDTITSNRAAWLRTACAAGV